MIALRLSHPSNRAILPLLASFLVLSSILANNCVSLLADEQSPALLIQSISALEKDLSAVRGLASLKDLLQLDELKRLVATQTAKANPVDIGKDKAIHEKFDAFAREARNRAVAQRPSFQAVQKNLDAYIAAFPAPKPSRKMPGQDKPGQDKLSRERPDQEKPGPMKVQTDRPKYPWGPEGPSKDAKKVHYAKESKVVDCGVT